MSIYHTGKSLDNAEYLDDLINRFVPADRRRVCVQAGAHTGVWPRFLSAYFETVITFEPFHENFTGIVHRGLPDNVFPIRAGLWSEARRADFEMRGKNRKKGHVVEGYHDPVSGIYPLVTIDGVVPRDEVDFICLDVEGAEIEALVGARWTIRRSLPVLAVEINVNRLSKGEENYTTTVDGVLEVLPSGYREVETYGIDRVFVHDGGVGLES